MEVTQVREAGIQTRSGVSRLKEALENQSGGLAQWLMESTGVYALLLAPDGSILERNRAAYRVFWPDPARHRGSSIWDYLANPAAESLQQRLGQTAGGDNGPLLLNVIDDEQQPISLEVKLFPGAGGGEEILLLAVHESRHDSLLNSEACRLTNDLSVLVRETARKNRELEKTNETVRRLARTDALTGLANRRTLQEALHREVARAERQGNYLSVIVADLDHFKLVNDRYGHSTGDQVLVLAAAVLGDQLRPFDLAARYGGEEFILLLPGIAVDGAMAIAERKRREIAEIDIPGCPERVTVSLGVAAWVNGESPEAMVERADAALYNAKRSGRNRVESAGQVQLQAG